MALLLVFTVCIFLSIAYSSCPFGWHGYNTECYLFFTRAHYNWITAAARCRNSSAHLAFINSADENKFLADQLRQLLSHDEMTSDSRSSVWIGGSDDQEEGIWEWYGTDEPLTHYSNWSPGEPDAGDGEHDEDCLVISGHKDFRWQDRKCKDHHYYICEKPKNVQPVG